MNAGMLTKPLRNLGNSSLHSTSDREGERAVREDGRSRGLHRSADVEIGAMESDNAGSKPELVCAPCWICLEDGPDENGEPLVRDCAPLVSD